MRTGRSSGGLKVWWVVGFVGLLCSLAGAQAGPQVGTQTLGSVSGVVVDADGAEIAGARVTLASGGLAGRVAVTDGQGVFRFGDVAAGPFRLAVSAAGFATALRSGTVNGVEAVEVPVMVLGVATQVDVEVTVSRQEEAAEEVRVEEKQRLAGFLPNFYVSYNWHAAPLSAKQKFGLAWKTMIDPANLLVNGGIAGIEQAQNDFKGYGQGAAGYGKRFGAANGDFVSGTLLGGAVLPVLFRQDPRYFYKGTGSVRSRLLYALSTAVICRGDNGRWQVSYSGILGDLAAGGISNLYYPASDRNGASLTIENGLLSVALDGVGNAIQEFVFRRITPHAASYPAARP